MKTVQLFALLLLAAPASAQTFTAPLAPPETEYVVDMRLDAESAELLGHGKVIVRNTGRHTIRALQFQWTDLRAAPFEVTLAGATNTYAPASQPIEIALPQPLRVGMRLELSFRFRRPAGRLENGWRVASAFPRLWWGYETHAAYDIAIEAPSDVIVATSARRDARTGRYRGDHIRTFGVFFGRGYEVAEATAVQTRVRSVFRPSMRECAQLVLETATDAIRYYRARFGMYPHNTLTIIPGAPRPYGGYPFATAMVLVHGQEACGEKPRDTHWRWIAAHEVAHQYWLEQVLAKDPEQGFGWLMIGLGIWTDREYARSRGISVHHELLDGYADAVRKGLNTTIEIAPEQLRKIGFDYNSVVTHHKAFGVISALAAVVGHETFERIYARTLREYAGRRLGTAEFRRIAEEESAQDLGWFFVPLLRSSRFASYEITDTATSTQGGRQSSRVRITSAGKLLLPVPVEAEFANGQRMRLVLDRTLEEQTLEFAADAPLQRIVIDPDREFPLVSPPPAMTPARLAELVDELPWSGAREKALRLYERATEQNVITADVWMKLALILFDSSRFRESLDAFERMARSPDETNANWRFGVDVWRGMLHDLAGRREAAVEFYTKALAQGGEPTVQHTQFALVLDRSWVEQRLRTPFAWPPE